MSILLFLLFFSTCEKDKTNNISKSPEVVPSDRPTSSHSERCHMCQSGQANTAGKGSPVIPPASGTHSSVQSSVQLPLRSQYTLREE